MVDCCTLSNDDDGVCVCVRACVRACVFACLCVSACVCMCRVWVCLCLTVRVVLRVDRPLCIYVSVKVSSGVSRISQKGRSVGSWPNAPPPLNTPLGVSVRICMCDCT